MLLLQIVLISFSDKGVKVVGKRRKMSTTKEPLPSDLKDAVASAEAVLKSSFSKGNKTMTVEKFKAQMQYIQQVNIEEVLKGNKLELKDFLPMLQHVDGSAYYYALHQKEIRTSLQLKERPKEQPAPKPLQENGQLGAPPHLQPPVLPRPPSLLNMLLDSPDGKIPPMIVNPFPYGPPPADFIIPPLHPPPGVILASPASSASSILTPTGNGGPLGSFQLPIVVQPQAPVFYQPRGVVNGMPAPPPPGTTYYPPNQFAYPPPPPNSFHQGALQFGAPPHLQPPVLQRPPSLLNMQLDSQDVRNSPTASSSDDRSTPSPTPLASPSPVLKRRERKKSGRKDKMEEILNRGMMEDKENTKEEESARKKEVEEKVVCAKHDVICAEINRLVMNSRKGCLSVEMLEEMLTTELRLDDAVTKDMEKFVRRYIKTGHIDGYLDDGILFWEGAAKESESSEKGEGDISTYSGQSSKAASIITEKMDNLDLRDTDSESASYPSSIIVPEYAVPEPVLNKAQCVFHWGDNVTNLPLLLYFLQRAFTLRDVESEYVFTITNRMDRLAGGSLDYEKEFGLSGYPMLITESMITIDSDTCLVKLKSCIRQSIFCYLKRDLEQEVYVALKKNKGTLEEKALAEYITNNPIDTQTTWFAHLPLEHQIKEIRVIVDTYLQLFYYTSAGDRRRVNLKPEEGFFVVLGKGSRPILELEPNDEDQEKKEEEEEEEDEVKETC